MQRSEHHAAGAGGTSSLGVWRRDTDSSDSFLRLVSPDGARLDVEERMENGHAHLLVWLHDELLDADDTDDICTLLREAVGPVVGPSDIPHVNARGERALKYFRVSTAPGRANHAE